jgi:ribosomal protein S26
VILSRFTEFRLYRKAFYPISCFLHIDNIKMPDIRTDKKKKKEAGEMAVCIKK